MARTRGRTALLSPLATWDARVSMSWEERRGLRLTRRENWSSESSSPANSSRICSTEA